MSLSQEPADLSKQFPDLAEDFHIPQFFEPDQFFSSVFRISSCGLQLWTHYDVSPAFSFFTYFLVSFICHLSIIEWDTDAALGPSWKMLQRCSKLSLIHSFRWWITCWLRWRGWREWSSTALRMHCTSTCQASGYGNMNVLLYWCHLIGCTCVLWMFFNSLV